MSFNRRTLCVALSPLLVVTVYDTSVTKQFLQHVLKTHGSLESEIGKWGMNYMIDVSKNNQRIIAAAFYSAEYDHRSRVCRSSELRE
jgi:hypothetical protein